MEATGRRPPAVGRVLTHESVRPIVARLGSEVATRLVRATIDRWHAEPGASCSAVEALEAVCREVVARDRRLRGPLLRRVINATGIVVHTNLGRAPMSAAAAAHVATIAQGYSNLEFDLERGKRGNRQDHLRDVLCLLTGAEDVLIVNNNAAALLLVLRAFAARREVVVSRGELIEIGDSFRLLDVMSASGARVVEVGSTNRTHLADYAAAVGRRTALLLKAHTSNFRMMGFGASVSVKELSALARERAVPCVYDLGSGMLRRPDGVPLGDEPSVAEALAAGADLITCSGDKLLGGAQAGIVAGRRDLVARLARTPLLRALRPGRLTLAALEAVARQYLDEGTLRTENPTFRMLARAPEELRRAAERLRDLLRDVDVAAEVVPSEGQVGGGALPGVALPGWAVALTLPRRPRGGLARGGVYRALLRGVPPVVAILREGRLVLDVRTVQDDELLHLPVAIRAALARG